MRCPGRTIACFIDMLITKLVMSGHLPREKACFIDMIMTNTRDVGTSSTWESLLYWYDHDKHSWCRDIFHVRKPALLIWSWQTLVMSGHLPREKACFIDMIMTNTRDVGTSSTWESLLYWYDHDKHSWCRDIFHVRKPALLIWSWQTLVMSGHLPREKACFIDMIMTNTRDVGTSSTWESLLYWYDHDKHSWCRDIFHVRKPALLIWSWQTLVMSGYRPREKACFIDMIMTNTRDVGISSTWESLLYWYDHDKHSWCRDIFHVRKPALLIWSWQTLVMSGHLPREKACFIDMIMKNTRDVGTSSTWESLLYWYDHDKHSWCRDIFHVRKPALLIWSLQTLVMSGHLPREKVISTACLFTINTGHTKSRNFMLSTSNICLYIRYASHM